MSNLLVLLYSQILVLSNTVEPLPPTVGLAGLIALFFGAFYICFICVFYLLIFVVFILWIIMLIDVIKRDDLDFPNGNKDSKVMWLLIILLTGWIGGLIYYFLIYKKQPRKS